MNMLYVMVLVFCWFVGFKLASIHEFRVKKFKTTDAILSASSTEPQMKEKLHI